MRREEIGSKQPSWAAFLQLEIKSSIVLELALWTAGGEAAKAEEGSPFAVDCTER